MLRLGDQRAGPGRADLRGTLRTPAGAEVALCPPPPGSRGASAASSCRPYAIALLSAGPARTSSGPCAPPLGLPALGLGAPDLPAPYGRQPSVSPGGGSGR